MTKQEVKTRDIRYFSKKNQRIMLVHTEKARKYADTLEGNPEVLTYEVGKEINNAAFEAFPKIGIRSYILSEKWVSDFHITFKDGTEAVREISSRELLLKESEVMKLELSRRYWKYNCISDWKIVLF